jgi:hypothetical protein
MKMKKVTLSVFTVLSMSLSLYAQEAKPVNAPEPPETPMPVTGMDHKQVQPKLTQAQKNAKKDADLQKAFDMAQVPVDAQAKVKAILEVAQQKSNEIKKSTATEEEKMKLKADLDASKNNQLKEVMGVEMHKKFSAARKQIKEAQKEVKE